MDKDRVVRFGGAARFAHWGHTVTFLVLLFTGLILFTPALTFLAPVFGGYVNASLVHKIMAVFFTIIPLIALVKNFKGFIEWWKDVFSFGMDDIKFLLKFPLEFFGFEVKGVPPQSKFNGGEKMNSVVTTTACVFLALSGYVMWFKAAFPLVVVQWAYPIHGLCMLVATCMVCMHAYLGSFHPGSGESFWGMWKGAVRSDWAAHHHGKWYDDITKS